MSRRAWPAALAPTAISLLVVLAIASALILGLGQAPLAVYRVLLSGTWGNPYGAGQVLFKATPLMLTGLAVLLPLRAGLFNVGGEGQTLAGGFACALLGAALPTGMSWPLALPLCLGAGLAGGALVGGLPGVLRAFRGAHEVIVTILLNFVVAALLQDLGRRFYLRESVHTAAVVAGARLPLASRLVPALSGSGLSAGLLLSLSACALTGWALGRTRFGFRLAVVGQGPEAAAAFGVAVARSTALALAIGGGLAGLAGATLVLGYKHYYEEGFAGGVGFMGIAVALLARGRAAGVIAAALLLATLSQGGLAINATVPKELVDVLQAALILAVAVALAAQGGSRLDRGAAGGAA